MEIGGGESPVLYSLHTETTTVNTEHICRIDFHSRPGTNKQTLALSTPVFCQNSLTFLFYSYSIALMVGWVFLFCFLTVPLASDRMSSSPATLKEFPVCSSK